MTALRRAEQEAMAAYGRDGRCLMGFLQDRSTTRRPRSAAGAARSARGRAGPTRRSSTRALVAEAQRHLRGAAVELSVKKQWPATGDRKQQKIPEELRLWGARALARPGDGGWDELLETALAGGAAGDDVLDGVPAPLAPFSPAWVTWVPSRDPRRDALLRGLAAGVAGRLGVPAVDVVRREADRPPMAGCATRPRSSTTCAARSRSPTTCPPARSCCWTTSPPRAGPWRWSAASCATAARATSSASACCTAAPDGAAVAAAAQQPSGLPERSPGAFFLKVRRTVSFTSPFVPRAVTVSV